MPEITRIEPGKRMSNAVVHGGLVYLSGVVGTPEGDVTSQTREIVAEIDRLLALAGSDKTRILRAQIWLSDIRTFDEMNAVWDSWLAPAMPPPAPPAKRGFIPLTARWKSSSPPCRSKPLGHRQSAVAITQRISNIRDAPSQAVFPEGSKGGDTSTRSAPTI